jgi:hypothetical protein
MSETKVEGATRGEYNRKFDVSAVREQATGFTFVCPETQQYVMLLKSGRTDVYNGIPVVTKDLYARFEDFRFFTTDPAVADLIRNSPAVTAGRVREFSTLQRESRETQVVAAAKALAADPELLKAAIAQLKTGKGNAPEVKPVPEK